MSCFARVVRPCAFAVRARNDGANPRLRSAKAPFFTKTLRETMIDGSLLTPLKFGRPEVERERVAILAGDRSVLAGREVDREVYPGHQRPRVDPGICRVLVTGRRLA